MADRDGSLSTFPISLDQIDIKVPFDDSLPLNQQNLNSLERAHHFNHMFDIVYMIQTYLLAGSGGAGGSVVTRHSSGISGANTDVYGSNIKVGYSTVSLSLTGNTITVSALVPSSFSANPFYAKGFSMAHNVYVDNRAGSSLVEGIWANKSYDIYGPFNFLVTMPQFFTMVRPLTGRIFELTITNFPIHSTSENVIPTWIDTLRNNGADYQSLTNRPGWAGSTVNMGAIVRQTINGEELYELFSEKGNANSWAFVYTNKLSQYLTNCYVEFGPIKEAGWLTESGVGSWRFIDAAGKEVYSRFGPMIRAIGTPTNASFYCLSIGDVDSNRYIADRAAGATKARLLKVQNNNLTNNTTSTPTTGSGWGIGSTITQLWASDITLNKTTYKYRLKALGTTISVEESVSPYSTWNTIASAVDTTLASGAVGFFSQSLDGAFTRGIRIHGPVSFVDLVSNPLNLEAQFLYLEVSPETNLTME